MSRSVAAPFFAFSGVLSGVAALVSRVRIGSPSDMSSVEIAACPEGGAEGKEEAALASAARAAAFAAWDGKETCEMLGFRWGYTFKDLRD